MPSITIQLDPSALAFVERQVANQRFDSASAFLEGLIVKERRQLLNEQVERLLDEATESGEALMTKEDWEEIRQEARRRITQRKGLAS